MHAFSRYQHRLPWGGGFLRRPEKVLLGMLLLVGWAGGCNTSAPPSDLHPVRGVVVGLKGEPINTGGTIEFCSPTDSKIRSVASFDSNGRFELHSRTGAEQFAGAQPGTYQVTVSPSGAKYVEPMTLPELVVVAPQDNELTIKIDASKL